MSLPQKGSRRLVVGDQTYRWLFVRRPVGSERRHFWPLSLHVELAGEPGQRLVVRFDYPVWHEVAGKPQYPGPGWVRTVIETALAAGWQPGCAGLADFELDGHAFLPEAERPGAG